MKLPALLLASLLLAAPAAALKVPNDVMLGMLGSPLALLPLLPMMHAHETMPAVGFERWPYESQDEYAGGTRRFSVGLRGARQWTEAGRHAWRAGARLSTERRLGVDADWTRFSAGSLRQTRRSDFATGHFTANLSEEPERLLHWGVGAATLQGPYTRWGGSLLVDYEVFPAKPLALNLRYSLSVMNDRRAYHDLRLEAGAAFGPVGLGVGYRGFLNPLRNSYGPEATLRIWL